MSSQPSVGNVVLAILLLVIMVAVYFAPYLHAKSKGHKDTTAIGMLNLFLGWTLIGWVAALVWANTKPAQSAVQVPTTSRACLKCGAINAADSAYCSSCGTARPTVAN